MARLGEILVSMKACDAGRLREALESQVLFGGRLGTNLLDLGGVAEKELAEALARQHGVRALFGEIPVQPEALALLPQAQADRLDVVPWQLSGRRLAVLCADPRDLRKLDEVSFATGKIVEAVVVPEARLWSLLRRHYGAERPSRGGEVEWSRQRRAEERSGEPSPPAPPPPDLMDEAEFQAMYAERVVGTPPPGAMSAVVPTATSTPAAIPFRAATPSAAPTPTTAATPEAIPTLSRTASPAATPIPTLPRIASPAATPIPTAARPTRPPPLPRPPPPPDPFAGRLQSADETLADLQAEATGTYVLPGQEHISMPGAAAAPAAVVALGFQEAVAALNGVADRGAIARIVLRYALSRFRRAVLLTVHASGADGWEGLGEGLTPQTVARVHVGLGKPGLVQTVVESRSHVLGPLARTEANIQLLRALGGGAPKTSFAMPILARGRVVNVLYADDGRGRMVDPDGVGELLILAAKISQSYDVLLSRAR